MPYESPTNNRDFVSLRKVNSPLENLVCVPPEGQLSMVSPELGEAL